MSGFRRLLLMKYAATPVVTTRRIYGWSGGSGVTIYINGTGHYRSVDSEGYWEYEIPSGTVITSLANMLSSSTDNGYEDNNKITYVYMDEIGDTSQNTSMEYAFYNCLALTGVTFGDSFDTSSVTTFYQMFNGCYAMTFANISMFDMSGITETESYYEGTANIFYMASSETYSSAMTELSIPFIPTQISSNTFYGCAAITDFYPESIKYTFKLKAPENLTAASLQRIVDALYDWSSSSNPPSVELWLSSASVSALSTTQKNTITAKGWTLNS